MVSWLDFLFSHLVQPALDKQTLWMIYGYPACQSALARLNEENPDVADRFEVFAYGLELANGFYELTDAREQEARFDHELAVRKQRELPAPGKDNRLLAALRNGLPDCSGIAMGLDRILMLLAGAEHIDDVLCFPTEIS